MGLPSGWKLGKLGTLVILIMAKVYLNVIGGMVYITFMAQTDLWVTMMKLLPKGKQSLLGAKDPLAP